ncbi:MAG: type III pantothenate kinase [Bacillota bacterium]|jgi:type III pantothenate kinase
MLFAIDAGNTNVVVGIFKGQDLQAHWRMSTDRHKTEDEYGMAVLNMLEHSGFKANCVRGAIIASVVPPLTPVLEKMVKRYFKISPIIVGPGTKTGINVKYENPKEVGPDRITNAVAAYRMHGGPVIVVDYGTATTFDVISKEGEYLGGAIAPGILTSTDALFDKAARLPRIELAKPGSAIGRTTVESMQSGIVFGFVGQTDGLVTRLKKELGGEAQVVATGGLANLVAQESSTIQHVEPMLTLKGLQIIYQKNLSPEEVFRRA